MAKARRTEFDPSPSLRARTNAWAIGGFILSIIGAFPFGLLAGFLGFREIAVTGEKGRGLAIASMIVGGLGTGLYLLWLFLSIR